MSRRPLRTNFVFNLLFPLARLAVSFVTVPIYIHHVGDARYGVISIVWLLAGYFGFLDLGLSRAAANALAKLREAPQPERARVLLTTFVLNFGFGVVGSAFLLILGGYLLQRVISIPDALRPEIARSFPWIAAVFPMALISGVAIGALESSERFLLANMLQILGMSVSQIAPVVMAVVVGPSLTVVIPAAAVAQASGVVIALAVVYRLEGPFSLRAFAPQEARALLGYGGWITVSGIISPLLVSLDQFLIGSLMGVAAVAHYSIPMNFVVRSQIFPAALARTFFPRMSSSSGDDARELGGRAICSLGYGYAAICAPGIILSPAVLSLLDKRQFRARGRSGGPNRLRRRVDQWACFHCSNSPSKSGPARHYRQTAHDRNPAVSRNTLGFDHEFGDHRRGHRMELTHHGRRAGAFLGVRNPEAADHVRVVAGGASRGERSRCSFCRPKPRSRALGRVSRWRDLDYPRLCVL